MGHVLKCISHCGIVSSCITQHLTVLRVHKLQHFAGSGLNNACDLILRQDQKTGASAAPAAYSCLSHCKHFQNKQQQQQQPHHFTAVLNGKDLKGLSSKIHSCIMLIGKNTKKRNVFFWHYAAVHLAETLFGVWVNQQSNGAVNQFDAIAQFVHLDCQSAPPHPCPRSLPDPSRQMEKLCPGFCPSIHNCARSIAVWVCCCHKVHAKQPSSRRVTACC